MHDIIIVGAGTAGSVLADRLTRSGSLRVLLIEAGGKPSSPFVRMPAGFIKLFKTKLDWNLEGEPESAADGRRVYIPRGKMLGGSSNMNAQIHQWCHPADFDGWEAAGATGWGWDAVAPVFREMERWLGDDGDAARGREGPMVISPNAHAHRLSRDFVAAARAAGLGEQPAYNGGAYEGAWLAELAHRDGRRFSAYDACLKPALSRPNLTVMRDGLVTRILIDDGRATGVTVRRGNAEEIVRGGGVVLAAGAFGSPQLLMLSGIGPAAALRELGIAVLRDVPEVGENLHEHPMAVTIFRTREPDTMKNAESPLSLLRYFLLKRGMLASNGAEAIAFARSGEAAGAAPDIELIFAPFEWRNEALDPPAIHAVSIGAALVAPKSRGHVRLKSADPLDAPAISFGLLSDPDGTDAKAMIAAVRLARRIASAEPLASALAGEEYPGAYAESDDALRAAINARLQTVYHPSSTCRMGADPGAVVDPELRVQGVEGLWVADASVMPAVPRGHPNAVVAMIANRGAEMIGGSLGG